MELHTAKTAGFCFGVSRGIDIVTQYLDKGQTVCTLGEIIHNPQMVQQLARRGVTVVETPSQTPKDALLVIRSHGVGRSVYDELEKNGIEYVDATCPYVAKIQKIVREQATPDTLVLIAGDSAHPEVQGILGHCHTQAQTFGSLQELVTILEKQENLDKKTIVMVAQTTFNLSEWDKSILFIKKECTNPRIFDTICKATFTRQKEAAELAARCDRMIVVGGRHSSNTKKLYEICSGFCPTVFVETADELRAVNFHGASVIGVTAGASTPVCIIKEVQKIMSEIFNDQEELSFEEMLNQSFKSTYTGEKVVGVVTAIAPNEITVDIGTKHAGYVPLHELTSDPTAKPEDIVKIGDKIELQVTRVNDVDGILMLSKKRLDAIAGFEKVMAAAETGEILEGTVAEVVKGGVLAVTNGVRVFIPASQATVSKSDPLENLLKQKVSFKILEVNRQRRRAVGSIRAVMKEQRKVLEELFWKDVEIGKKYQGVVKSLTDYGAFVDLGGVDGMVHKSELSWARIKKPSDVVKVGDVLEVYVKDIDVERKKISLGYKKTEDNPWEVLKKSYDVGTVATVKVVSMTPFGAFAQIIPGVDGLIHISQISAERINQPQDVLSIGQEVQVKITELDWEKKRVSLSMRALVEDAEIAAQQEETPTEEVATEVAAPAEESAE